MDTKPRAGLDVSICTVLAFVDLDLDRLAAFLGERRDRVRAAVDGLVRSGHVIHSPADAFAFRNSGYWHPDAGADDELSGPGSPRRRHGDWRDDTSPYYEKPDDWQLAQDHREQNEV